MRSQLSRLSRLLLPLAALFVLAARADAQCPMPDNLDGGPCCAITNAVLPMFPDFTVPSIEICWKDCNPDNIINYAACWSAPTPAATAAGPLCSVFLSRLQLKDPAGGVLWSSGPMRLWYSRTWFESDGANQRLQVWRFLVNGDLRPSAAAGGVPCPVPNCAAAFGNRVHTTGYIDYALDCLNGRFFMAWMLNHECDRIDHAPGFPRATVAGSFHRDRTYTWVGPSPGFVVTPLGPNETGPVFFEAVRRLDLPGGGLAGACYFEERLIDGFIQTFREVCVCRPVAAGPFQYFLSRLDAFGACGTRFSTTGGPFPKVFVSKSIGFWTDPTRFPGPEHLRWNISGYSFLDACTGATRKEVFYGVSTFRGYDAFQINAGGIGGPLPTTFIDQGNSLRNAAGAILMNVDYVSDHIVNINIP